MRKLLYERVILLSVFTHPLSECFTTRKNAQQYYTLTCVIRCIKWMDKAKVKIPTLDPYISTEHPFTLRHLYANDHFTSPDWTSTYSAFVWCNKPASQSCAIAKSEKFWRTIKQSNLAYKRMAVTKASKSFVFVLTQLYYGQWSSLTFCLPSPVACQNCSHLANAGGCETGFKPKQLFAGWRYYHSNLAVIPLQLFATEHLHTQISHWNEGFVCSYQLFQFRNSPKQNAP